MIKYAISVEADGEPAACVLAVTAKFFEPISTVRPNKDVNTTTGVGVIDRLQDLVGMGQAL